MFSLFAPRDRRNDFLAPPLAKTAPASFDSRASPRPSLFMPLRHHLLPRRHAPRAARGFALIVTIVLVAFLVLILVGLATFTRVETQVAANTQQLAAARQNALLGLNLAVGQLQRYAGPDQRITARGDLVTGVANPLFTGVWDSTAAAGLDPATPMVWLVSGNENPAAPRAVAPATDLSAASDAVLLVGTNTAGPENTAPAPSNHVRARRVAITSDSVPGFDDARDVGAYAYWVGDEGVKARLDLANPGLASSPDATDAARAFASAPRAAVELMERDPAPAPGAVGTLWGSALFPYSASTISSVLQINQLPFYADSGSAAPARTAARARVHDLTTHSAGLLADTAAGGLRRDLNRILESNTVGPANTDLVFPAEGAVGAASHQSPPAWGRLRNWWQNPVAHTGSISPSLPSPSGAPVIAPVPLWAELGFGYFYELAPTGTAGVGPYRLRFQGFPRVALWNPYNVTLAGGDYEIGISSFNNVFNLRIQRADDSAFVRLFSFFGFRFAANTSFAAPPEGQGQRQYLRFRVTVPDLAPGENRIFSIPSGSSGAVFNNGVTTLTSGDFPGSYTLFSGTYDIPVAQTPPYQALAFASDSSSSGVFAGGEHGFYLRAAGLASPGVPDSNTIPTSTYRFIPRLGIGQNGLFGLGGNPGVFSVPDAPVSAPQVRMTVRARLGNVHPSNPQRWIANANPAGLFNGRHPADGDTHPFYTTAIYFQTNTSPNVDPDDNLNVGRNFDLPSSGSAGRLPLIEPRPSDPGLVQSIAHLQHAQLVDTALGPTYAVGNSLQSPRITPRTATFTAAPAGNPAVGVLYDYSHRLNTALWDRYFFSTVPAGTTDAQLAAANFALPNARLRPLGTSASALLDADTAAANLLLSGAFNINSTSEQAWRALLASAHGLRYDPVTGNIVSAANALQNPFSRFQRPRGDSDDVQQGYRQLTDDQLAALAANIVAEVRARGPFRSLGDFVNRRLATDATGLKGALQAAIDATDLSGTAANRLNDRAPTNQDAVGAAPSGHVLDLEAYRGVAGTSSQLPVSSRSAFMPGHLTQADLLSRIGAALSARSDTFVIRTYGESVNPATDAVEARAWAEAIVQRLPAYVDPALAPESTPVAGTENERFGRRFVIVSFRWLSPEDL